MNISTLITSKAIIVKPTISGKLLHMELDTGTTLCIISEKDYKSYLKTPDTKLEPCNKTLRSYSGHTMRSLGKLRRTVKGDGQEAQLDLYVVKQNGPPLFGRDCLEELKLNFVNIKALHLKPHTNNPVDYQTKLKQLLDQHKSAFLDERVKNIQAHMSIKDYMHPKFHKAKKVSYSSRSKIEQEFERLQSEGIINTVSGLHQLYQL